MVKLKELNFVYKRESPIFLNFNLEIGDGQRWSIIGPSGCGKTSLLYLLAGLRVPTAGTIEIHNGCANGHKVLTGLILQDYGLLPWSTAFENVALGLKIQGCDKKSTASVTQDWLAKLGIDHVAGNYPAELSGGQRQRVAIARTLALEPALLLMDEPFASLDSINREDLLNLTLKLWQNLTSTMILVTHNIEEAVYWGNYILVLGHPPNTKAVIIANPGSGQPSYRSEPDFILKCQQLRTLVEYNSQNQNAGDKVE
jgi:ABC-type nitrate/sulfonate/bicarbonate transport system ATPase subunit